jgi:hypothetical protein
MYLAMWSSEGRLSEYLQFDNDNGSGAGGTS